MAGAIIRTLFVVLLVTGGCFGQQPNSDKPIAHLSGSRHFQGYVPLLALANVFSSRFHYFLRSVIDELMNVWSLSRTVVSGQFSAMGMPLCYVPDGFAALKAFLKQTPFVRGNSCMIIWWTPVSQTLLLR